MTSEFPLRRRGARGFTLIELMIVVVVIAILASVAYPSYRDSVRKSRRADAQASLAELAQFMQRVYTENNSFRPGGNPPALPYAESPKDGSSKYYDLSLSAITATSFTLRAAPKGGQAGDGLLQLGDTGARSWDKNDNGTQDSGENAW